MASKPITIRWISQTEKACIASNYRLVSIFHFDIRGKLSIIRCDKYKLFVCRLRQVDLQAFWVAEGYLANIKPMFNLKGVLQFKNKGRAEGMK